MYKGEYVLGVFNGWVSPTSTGRKSVVSSSDEKSGGSSILVCGEGLASGSEGGRI
jgi:hypothetical protein